VQTEALVSHLYAKENAKQKLRRKKEAAAGAGEAGANDDAETEAKMPINTNVLEATNVVYPAGPAKPNAKTQKQKEAFQVGSDGFQRILKAVPIKGTTRIQYEYYGEPYLYPNETYLKTYAAKLHRVAELIQKAKGIVMIYSHFIWSGVMPMALVLEHLGYTPYQEESYLRKASIMVNPAETSSDIPKTPGRHYAVFCSDPTISGVDGFPKKLEAINDPKNANGETIKVILMSPVASEGISFQNVREVHILDPWFHLNRLEQVIGRSIRTCSHKQLPLAERNVVVYSHVVQYPASSSKRNQETYDVYTYHLAADKKKKTMEIERVIRDHALDCSIQRHLNYYPKNLFPFDMRLITAQQRETLLRLGDSPELEPQCAANAANAGLAPKPKFGRKETYAPLRMIAKERLWKYLAAAKKPQGNAASWPIQTLLQHIQLPNEIGLLALDDLLEEWNREGKSRLVRHADKLWIEQIPNADDYRPIQIHINSFQQKPAGNNTEASPSAPQVPPPAKEASAGCAEMADMLLNNQNYSDYEPITMVMFLTLLNTSCWETIAKRIIRENIQNRLTRALWKEGWLISANELPVDHNEPRASQKAWAGYCQIDLVKAEKDFDIRLAVGSGSGNWRDATRTEMALLQKNRVFQEPPEPIYGFYVADLKNQAFKFKLMQDTVGKRVKTGIVATTLPALQLQTLLDSLKAEYESRTKQSVPILPNFEGKKGKSNQTNRAYLASFIAYYLGLLGRLRIPPYYKLKVKMQSSSGGTGRRHRA
jgi:hypothetical protein